MKITIEGNGFPFVLKFEKNEKTAVDCEGFFNHQSSRVFFGNDRSTLKKFISKNFHFQIGPK